MSRCITLRVDSGPFFLVICPKRKKADKKPGFRFAKILNPLYIIEEFQT